MPERSVYPAAPDRSRLYASVRQSLECRLAKGVDPKASGTGKVVNVSCKCPLIGPDELTSLAMYHPDRNRKRFVSRPATSGENGPLRRRQLTGEDHFRQNR